MQACDSIELYMHGMQTSFASLLRAELSNGTLTFYIRFGNSISDEVPDCDNA